MYIDANRPETHFLTPADHRLWAQRLATGLQAAGLQQGDRVPPFYGNGLFYPVIFMGVITAGGVFTGANPTYIPQELTYQLRDSGAKFMIYMATRIEIALEATQIAFMGKEQVFAVTESLWEEEYQHISGIKS